MAVNKISHLDKWLSDAASFSLSPDLFSSQRRTDQAIQMAPFYQHGPWNLPFGAGWAGHQLPSKVVPPSQAQREPGRLHAEWAVPPEQQQRGKGKLGSFPSGVLTEKAYDHFHFPFLVQFGWLGSQLGLSGLFLCQQLKYPSLAYVQLQRV